MIIIIFLLSAVVVFLLIKCSMMKRSAREISSQIKEKLEGDTNTLLDISSGDGDMRRLAASLNTELARLREQRRLYLRGDLELRGAVTNISHDLRTPLTAISGYLDLLAREEKSPEVEQYLSRIKERAEYMKSLTEELFRYSVVAAAKELSPERLCVNDVLEESIAAFYGAISASGIEPEITIPEERIERVADRSALLRVFGNILANALKYSSGDLIITMTAENGKCKTEFANSADNLEKISVERLFNRFYTVETASNSTGLGLSIAKLLVEQMNGKITAEIRGGRLVISVIL